ncbi:hypothetical protein [Corynebacterium belfantii]|uniref:hypothetical protein n=1 Tax=Corynebacterium belfantii TaxID=2014537 RepID=UPI00399C74EF
MATFEWVNWWNEPRLHQSLGYHTPAEVETEFLGTSPKSRHNKTQGKCLGTKPEALHTSQIQIHHPTNYYASNA